VRNEEAKAALETYYCARCGKRWEPQEATDNEYRCLARCGGDLVSRNWPAQATGWPVLAQLPSILALPLNDFLSEQHPVMRLHRLFDAAEVLTRFALIVGLAECLDHEGNVPTRLLNTLRPAIQQPSFGQWRRMLEAVRRLLPDELLLPSLPLFLDECLLPATAPGTPETSLLELRNRVVHSGALPQAEARRLLGSWAEWVQQLPDQLACFTVATVCVARGGRLLPLLGPDARLAVPLAEQAAPAQVEGQVLLVRDGQWRSLWPLCAYGRGQIQGPEGERVAASEAPQIYYRAEPARLLYAALGVDLPWSERSDTLGDFRRLFRLDQRQPAKARQPDDYEEELRRDADALVGRSAELKHLKDLIRGTESSVLWLFGSGGSGKSYLTAKLAIELNTQPGKRCRVAWRFKISDQSRCTEVAFLTHAIRQMSDWLGKSANPEQEAAALRGQLAGLLDEFATLQPKDDRARPPQVLFVLDGMDEIAQLDSEFAQRLLGFQRHNAIWLCSGRVEGRLGEVFSSDRCTHVFPGGMPPMTSDDVRSMLLEDTGELKYQLLALDRERVDVLEEIEQSNAAVDAVVERAHGLPLYVALVASDIRAGAYTFDELDRRLPPNLSAYHEERLRRLGVGELQAVLTPLIGPGLEKLTPTARSAARPGRDHYSQAIFSTSCWRSLAVPWV
jgi:hypothetical protein